MVLIKTGIFQLQATNGDQVIAGVGFTPKVVMLFANRSTVVNSFGSDSAFVVGFAVDTTAANQKAWNMVCDDGNASSDVHGSWQIASVYSMQSASNTTLATLTALSDDGFTINISINTGVQDWVSYVCLGGGDITNASIGHFNAPSATGDDAVTGIGFEPDFVLLLGTNRTVDNVSTDSVGSFSLGCFNNAGEQGVIAPFVKDGVGTMDTVRYQRVDKCLAMFNLADTTALTHEASFASTESDGFTLNYTTASVADKRVAYLALRGLRTKISSITSPTVGTPPVTQTVTGVGFEPRGMMFLSTGKTAGTTIIDHYRYSVGAANASSETCMWSGDEDAAAAAFTAHMVDDDACIRVSDEVASAASTTTQALADFTSLDSDGYTISWSTIDGSNAYQVIYIAFGDTAVAGDGQEGRERITTSMIQRPELVTTDKRYISTRMV